MYTILLADDEEAVRHSIRDLTPWEEYGFEVMAEASNGYEALEIVAETMPDVIITDIRMLYKDGISLISEIRDKYSLTVMVIILSGYDEFTYAQTALSLNVAEYVLKPVSVSSMREVLSRAKERLDADMAEVMDREKLEAFYQEAFEVYKEKFLISLIFPARLQDEAILADKAREYGIRLQGEMFAVSVVDLTAESIPTVALRKVVEEGVNGNEDLLSFTYEDQLVLIFSSPQNRDFEYIFTRQINRFLSLLESRIVHYFSKPLNIGTGEIVRHIKALPESYKSATEALNYASIYPEQHIISISDVETIESSTDDSLLGELSSDFVMAIKFGTEEETVARTHAFFRNLTDTADIQTRTLQAITAISAICSSYGRNIAALLGEENLFTSLSYANTAQRSEDLIRRLALESRNLASGEREKSHIEFVENAKRIIKAKYQDPTFSQENVTSEIAVSPAYFSTTFKKETGISFVQYLTNVRIEKAKDLLKHTEMKTYEIAETTGFSEPAYFSFIFKKNTGETPSHYRAARR